MISRVGLASGRRGRAIAPTRNAIRRPLWLLVVVATLATCAGLAADARADDYYTNPALAKDGGNVVSSRYRGNSLEYAWKGPGSLCRATAPTRTTTTASAPTRRPTGRWSRMRSQREPQLHLDQRRRLRERPEAQLVLRHHHELEPLPCQHPGALILHEQHQRVRLQRRPGLRVARRVDQLAAQGGSQGGLQVPAQQGVRVGG